MRPGPNLKAGWAVSSSSPAPRASAPGDFASLCNLEMPCEQQLRVYVNTPHHLLFALGTSMYPHSAGSHFISPGVPERLLRNCMLKAQVWLLLLLPEPLLSTTASCMCLRVGCAETGLKLGFGGPMSFLCSDLLECGRTVGRVDVTVRGQKGPCLPCWLHSGKVLHPSVLVSFPRLPYQRRWGVCGIYGRLPVPGEVRLGHSTQYSPTGLRPHWVWAPVS